MTYIDDEGAEGRVSFFGEPPSVGTTIPLPRETR